MASNNIQIHTVNRPEESANQAPYIHKIKRKASFQERLLRNSCIACAVLLGILALSNLETPWAQRASGTIERALTMKIDLDQSIGQMSFVQKIMPESALVFFNLSGETDLLRPVDGTLSHAYSEIQPYLIFECDDGTPVYLPSDGSVAAISRMSDGCWGVLIDNGSGIESVIAGMDVVSVSVGDTLKQRAEIGTSGTKVYFEQRSGGESIDPTQRLGL